MHRTTVLMVLMVVIQATADVFTYRLSRDVVPQHYSLTLRPDMDKDIFEGEVTITIKTHREEQKFLLHSSGLNITRATVNQFPANVTMEDDERISIKFEDGEYFQPGEHQIYLKFSGKFQEQYGLRKAPYQYKTHKGFLIANEFEPTHARKSFPCFDEPIFKARFNIRLVTPNDTYTALSNMPEIARHWTQQGIIYDFATSLKMSTYLVSIAITDYPFYEEILDYNNKSLPIRVYTYNASKENNHLAIEGAKTAIRFYTDYTGIDYPLPKLDMIEYNKGRISATETWGLVQFNQGLLTKNLNNYDEWQCQIVMFHELGHSWFGNLVTNDWWNDLWLQEGFASFMSYKLISKNYKTDLSSIKMTEIVEIDKSEEIPQLAAYLKTSDFVEKRFDKIVYTKGFFLLRALEHLIGEKAMQGAVTAYLEKHVFKTVTTNDFLSEIENQVPHTNVRSFLESYIYQSGYPVINVEKDKRSGSYVLKQIQTKGLNRKWTIPISYIYGNNTSGLLWLDKDVASVQLKTPDYADWIIFNTAKQPGIYLVKYSEELWANLINHLHKLPVTEEGYIIENIAALYQVGYINCDIVMQLIGKMGEIGKIFLQALFNVTVSVAKDLACFQSEYEIFQEYLNKKYQSIGAFLSQFNITCDEDEMRTPTNDNGQRAQHCAEWVSKNLVNFIKS